MPKRRLKSIHRDAKVVLELIVRKWGLDGPVLFGMPPKHVHERMKTRYEKIVVAEILRLSPARQLAAVEELDKDLQAIMDRETVAVQNDPAR